MLRKMALSFTLSLYLATSISNVNACTRDEIYNDAPYGGCTCFWLEACGGAALGTVVAVYLAYLLATENIPSNILPVLKIELSYLACMAGGMKHCDNWDWPDPASQERKCGLKMCDMKAFKTRTIYLANDRDELATAMELWLEVKEQAIKEGVIKPGEYKKKEPAVSGKDEKKESAEPKKAEEKTEKK